MTLTKELVTEALRQVPGASPGESLAASGLVHVSACEGAASIKVHIARERTPAFDALARAAHGAVARAAEKAGGTLSQFSVEFVDVGGGVVHTARFGGAAAGAPAGAPTGAPPSTPAGGGHTPIGGLKGAGARADGSGLPGVGRIIAVGAGKGGVGKSTIALNLAVGLARRGRAVGLLDADIYGPSMPTMLGLGPMEAMSHDGMIMPFVAHGIKCVTMGKLVEADKPLIWRGPMAHGAFRQLAEQTRWGELDDLVIDLPPGTGDISLTMAQALRLTGAVVVCTPQRVAQDDASRAVKMFEQLGVEVLGVVENMSVFVGDDGKAYEIFGRGGAEAMAKRLGVPFLGAVPITVSLRVNSDEGNPSGNFVAKGGRAWGPAETALAGSLEALVTRVEQEAALAEVRSGRARPVLKVR